jgi:hypothetical protein
VDVDRRFSTPTSHNFNDGDDERTERHERRQRFIFANEDDEGATSDTDDDDEEVLFVSVAILAEGILFLGRRGKLAF